MSEYINGEFLVSTDKIRLDIDLIHGFLAETYWAQNIPRKIVERSIEGSVCFGLYHSGKQVGFARMITDCATFAYLADVFIIEEYRGKGLSKWLMECILAFPCFKEIRSIMLATKDAHGLYGKFGFEPLSEPEKFMKLTVIKSYPNVKK